MALLLGPLPAPLSRRCAAGQLAAAALLLWLPLPVGGRNYFIDDPIHENRHKTDRCGNFECPAYQRPVPKMEEDLRIEVPDRCPNGASEDASPYVDLLTKCCQLKFVCGQSCGADMQLCFETYWECAESACGGETDKPMECLHEAGWNDIRFFKKESHRNLAWGLPFSGKETCKHFHELQRDSCDCVPQTEWEAKLKERFEVFFARHSPDLLNKKGKFKDKELWRSWKGKRPNVLLELITRRLDKIVHKVTFEDALHTEL